MKHWSIGVAVMLALLAAAPIAAQELEARTYSNAPVGLNIVGAGYGYFSGNIFMDPALPIEGLESRNSLLFASYGHTFGIGGRSAKVFVTLPASFRDWEAELDGDPVRATRKTDGIGDTRISLSWNFHGSPALKRTEFPSYRQKTIVGARLVIVAPTGKYDPDELVNLGSNRWVFKPEIGVSLAVADGWLLEFTGAVWLFTTNDDFLGTTLSQRPLWTVTAHGIRTFRQGFWVGVGMGYGEGGRTTVAGIERDTRQRNLRFGAVAAYPFTPAHGIRGSFVDSTADGAGAEFDAFSLAYTYTW